MIPIWFLGFLYDSIWYPWYVFIGWLYMIHMILYRYLYWFLGFLYDFYMISMILYDFLEYYIDILEYYMIPRILYSIMGII